MSRIDEIKQSHAEELEKQCRKNQVSFISVEKLLEAEKTKKPSRSAKVQWDDAVCRQAQMKSRRP